MNKKNKLSLKDESTNFLLYTAPNGQVKVEVFLHDETVWLTINQMSELFGVDKSGISRHLKNIYETDELERKATVAKFATVQNEGVRSVSRELEYYNLDAIISVGYRVNSIRGTQFRIWATKLLKEYISKLQIYLRNVVLITIEIQKQHDSFILIFKTNSTLLLAVIQQQRLYI